MNQKGEDASRADLREKLQIKEDIWKKERK